MPQVKKIILYDGVCNLCDFAVRFIIPRDPEAKFCFASLQGDFAKKLLKSPPLLHSVILVEGEKIYEHSTAMLRIASQLKFPWNLLGFLRIIPRPIRDAAYGLIARNRYRWFGKQETCLLPRPEWKTRFLD